MKRTYYFLHFYIFFYSFTATPLPTVSTLITLAEKPFIIQQRSSQPNFHELGHHIIAEFFECQNLNEENLLKLVLRKAAESASATVLSITTHQFEPAGVTGVAVLQESHISVHTWPEYGYAAIDIFTCGKHVMIEKAIEVLDRFFSPAKKQIVKLARGFDSEPLTP